MKARMHIPKQKEGFHISWEPFNVKELKLAARELRMKANQLEYLVEKLEEKEDVIDGG